jgi:hypothetical protein
MYKRECKQEEIGKIKKRFYSPYFSQLVMVDNGAIFKEINNTIDINGREWTLISEE